LVGWSGVESKKRKERRGIEEGLCNPNSPGEPNEDQLGAEENGTSKNRFHRVQDYKPGWKRHGEKTKEETQLLNNKKEWRAVILGQGC